MTPFTSILVDIDAMAAAHPAMDRAVELARHYGASLKIVDVVTVPPGARSYLPGDAESIVISTRQEHLARIAGTIGVPATVGVLRGRAVDALIDEVKSGGHDLLIRSHARDLAAMPRALGAIDMQLFRKCPCTVWAVGAGATAAPRLIVAAVHANRDDPEEQKLNRRIIETAIVMAQPTNATVIVFQAWNAFAEDMLRTRYSAEDMRAYVQAAEDSVEGELNELIASLESAMRSLPVERRKGNPEDVLPRFVVAEGVDLVVMGTVARAGVAGLVMGNTAERLLQRLPCSTMAVKPEGFGGTAG